MKMRITILILIPLLSLASEEKKAPPKAGPPSARNSTRVTIPAGAEKIDSNTWRHTDSQGKSWIYHRVPFGIMKTEEKPTAPAADSGKNAAAGGDSGQSVRRTPFGELPRARKKKELDAKEQSGRAGVSRNRKGETAAEKKN